MIRKRRVWCFGNTDVPDTLETRQGTKQFRFRAGDIEAELALFFVRKTVICQPVLLSLTWQPVVIKLQSSDVIHSFWIPSLAGKMDVIPGRENRLVIEASKDGTFRGQCAEFCGWQHAHMAITLVAHPAEDFERWRESQISTAEPPDDPLRKRGMEIFLSRPCVMCHQIRGTPAAGKVAPDLTHVGGRLHIAAGTLPNSRGNLAAWITDPQGIKPGARMPLVRLEANEIEPLTHYLEGLR
ncbi:c-type cytochrome [Sinorhizobium meliloti]|uniref:c-type cytochrome n=1 Tax=Rhizobium meliloti TaxID=382 RepID=UPI001F2E8E8C|nr:c-type cytochrome [Sinorhizobium meliloti]